MKYVFILCFLFLSFSCGKKCTSNDARCSEQPNTGMTCQAYFESWVYNSDKKKCEWKGYSGCNAIGFQTKEECEKCKCD